MKDIYIHFRTLLGFALLCFFTNIFGTILLQGYVSTAAAQENAELHQEIDNSTSHVSGAFSTVSPVNDHLPTHADTKLTTIAPKEEIPSKARKDNELDTQNINSHLSGSISLADPDH